MEKNIKCQRVIHNTISYGGGWISFFLIQMDLPFVKTRNKSISFRNV